MGLQSFFPMEQNKNLCQRAKFRQFDGIFSTIFSILEIGEILLHDHCNCMPHNDRAIIDFTKFSRKNCEMHFSDLTYMVKFSWMTPIITIVKILNVYAIEILREINFLAYLDYQKWPFQHFCWLSKY